MTNRKGYLTAEEAEKTLSVPCLLILRGLCEVVFPNRNRGKPSDVVYIHPVSPLAGNGPGFIVSGKQWEICVVPVLKDPVWIEQATGADAPSLLSDEDLLLYMGKALRSSFEQKGY